MPKTVQEQDFNELFQEVQQQFWWYKEKSNERFQKLEDLLTLAAQQVEIIQRKRAKKVKFENSFADRNIPARQTLDLLPHLKLQLPRFKEGTEVGDWLHDCEQYFTIYNIADSLKEVVAGMHLEGTARNWFQGYAAGSVSWEWIGFCQQITKRFGALFNEEAWSDMDTEASITIEEEEAVFDEVPGGEREDWQCEELLCKALGLEDFFKAKQNSEGNSTNAKVLECTSTFKSDDKEDLEVPTQLESQMSTDLTTFIQMEELRMQQPIPCSHSYCLDKKSCKYNREEGLIFDPGGSMKGSWSKSVMNLVMNQQHDSHQDCLPRLTNVKFLVNISNKVLENGEPKFANFNSLEEQDVVEEKPLTILINRGLLIDKASWTDKPTAANFFGLERKSSLVKKSMAIFDPGGLMQEDHSESINMMFKSLISIGEVKLEKIALINFDDGQFGQWQGYPRVVVQIEISDGIQGRSGKPGRVWRLEDHKASRKRNTIITFDPGGDTLVSMRLNLLRKHLKFYILSSLQDCSKMYLIQEKEDWKCKIHEDMDEFKGEGLSGTDHGLAGC